MENTLLKELHKDHETVAGILKKMGDTTEKEVEEREKLFQMLKIELIPHMKAEEHSLYSALAENEDVKQDTLEALEEHHVAEMVFKELEKMPCDHEGWLAKAVVFTELIDHHVEEEESVIFEDTEDVFSEDEIKEIYILFKDFKQKQRATLESNQAK